MAIDSVSSISPVMAATPLTTLSRPPETTPDARETARQENDERRVAEAERGASPAYLSGPGETASPGSVGTRTTIVASPNDVEGTIREASAQISRAETEPAPGDARAASAAYQAEASAQEDLVRQQRNNGTRTLDVLA